MQAYFLRLKHGKMFTIYYSTNMAPLNVMWYNVIKFPGQKVFF